MKRTRLCRWQAILLVVSTALLLWAWLPAVTDGMVGVGVLVPSAVAVCGILWGWLAPLKAIRKKGWKRAVVIVLCVVMALLVLLGGICTLLMVKYATATPAPGATVVVLGSKIHDDRPSRMLRHRLDLAGAYLRENPEANCVVAGGLGPGETYTEAYVMKKYLVEQWKIAPERIAREDNSTNTRENLQFALEIIREQGWSTHVVTATQIFHQYRAGRMALMAGAASVGGTACHTPVHLMLNYWVRECCAIGRLWLFGY